MQIQGNTGSYSSYFLNDIKINPSHKQGQTSKKQGQLATHLSVGAPSVTASGSGGVGNNALSPFVAVGN